MLVLSGDGRVSSTNATASELWAAGATELIGESFASLFAFEVVSTDPEFIQAQWEVLLAGVGRETVLTTQPREGSSWWRSGWG